MARNMQKNLFFFRSKGNQTTFMFGTNNNIETTTKVQTFNRH